MIHLTLLDGAKCAINPMQVFSVSAIGEGGVGCVIWSPFGTPISVKEGFDTVMKRIGEWGKL